MYSYFVMWRDSTYRLHRLNICHSQKLQDVPVKELIEAIHRRMAELKDSNYDVPVGTSVRVFPDPAHADPVIWSAHAPKGALKLAGEFPGRHIYSPEWGKK